MIRKAYFVGYATDGGLYFPEKIPELNKETLKKWQGLDYVGLVQEIASIFISEDEIDRNELRARIAKGYESFKIKEVVRINKMADGLNVAELFHGATMTFKDLALSVVGQLYDFFLERSKRRMTILVGNAI